MLTTRCDGELRRGNHDIYMTMRSILIHWINDMGCMMVSQNDDASDGGNGNDGVMQIY